MNAFGTSGSLRATCMSERIDKKQSLHHNCSPVLPLTSASIQWTRGESSVKCLTPLHSSSISRIDYQCERDGFMDTLQMGYPHQQDGVNAGTSASLSQRKKRAQSLSQSANQPPNDSAVETHITF